MNNVQYRSSTETFDIGSSTWTIVAHLPLAARDLRAASLGNSVFITGGKRGENDPPIAEILWFDSDANTWENISMMQEARSAHAVSTIKLEKEIINWCQTKN